MSTTVTGLLIYSSILTQQWVLHNNQDWWSIITSERSSLIFCTTVKSNFLKTSRRPLLNRREWNLFGKTQQTLRALKCGGSNKQARLHVFTHSVCLCYMCLNVRCACVTYVYTYQSATPQQDTRGQLVGGAEFLVRSSKVAFSSTLTREFCSRWSLCQNNGCCSLLSSSYRSRPSRYATPPPPRD